MSEANEVAPAWSPDGRKIAFETYTDNVSLGPYHVYVINADGSGRTHLAETRGDAAGEFTTPTPVWSPDGKKVAFAADNGIHVINADGSGEIRLTKADDEAHLAIVDQSPTWSPDGKKIAFSRTATDTSGSDAVSSAAPVAVPELSGIYVINADRTGLKKLHGGHAFRGASTWSPDSKKIAYAASQHSETDIMEPNIFVTNVDGTRKTRLTDVPYESETAPLWQPTGKKIAFAAGTAIYTINADGSSETLLDKTFDENIKEPSAWSPDGKTLVFLSQKVDGGINYVIVAEGRNLTRLNCVARFEGQTVTLHTSVSAVFVSEDGP